MMLSHEDVQDILRLLDSTSYDELTVETARFRLLLRRAAGGQWTQQTQVLSPPRRSESADRAVAQAASGGDEAASRTPIPGAAPPGAAQDAAARGPVGALAGLHEVRPPMLGTFYRAPKPGAAPFVEVGSRVRADTVVCIIETMKLMNSVCAGVAGVVVEVCLDDAQFADEGEVLLRIRPEDGPCA